MLDGIAHLTPRERQVMDLSALSSSSKEIVLLWLVNNGRFPTLGDVVSHYDRHPSLGLTEAQDADH